VGGGGGGDGERVLEKVEKAAAAALCAAAVAADLTVDGACAGGGAGSAALKTRSSRAPSTSEKRFVEVRVAPLAPGPGPAPPPPAPARGIADRTPSETEAQRTSSLRRSDLFVKPSLWLFRSWKRRSNSCSDVCGEEALLDAEVPLAADEKP
jgi:hypothetical protein